MRPCRVRRSTAAFVLGAALLAAGPAMACRCTEPGPASSYRDARAVVRAKVLSVTGTATGPGGATAVLSVGGAWKAPVGERITVETSTTCGYAFEQGRDYLVYLRAGEAGAPFSTRKCMGNQPLGEAGARVQWLQGKGKPAAVTPAR